MNEKTHKILLVTIVIVTGFLVSLSVYMDIPYLAIITLITGVLILRIVRKRTDEVIYDERLIVINQKASAVAIAVFTIGVTAIGWFLMTMGSNVDPAYEGLGYTFVYLGCGLLVLRTIFHHYYSWKLGG